MLHADPAARFTQVEFNNIIDMGATSALHTIYTCAVCEEKIRFHKNDFDTRARSDYTNLPDETAVRFNEWAKEHAFQDKEFLDWQCPGCRSSARVYIKRWAGGRHGDAGIVLIALLEDREGSR